MQTRSPGDFRSQRLPPGDSSNFFIRWRARAARPGRVKGRFSNGELLFTTTDLINIAGFLLVALLGFSPLLIVHWAQRQRPLSQSSLIARRTAATNTFLASTKTTLLLTLTHWALAITI